MYVYTKVIFNLNTSEVLDQDGFFYEGPVALCKGATQEMKNQAANEAELARKQADFYEVMSGSYNKMFAGQTAILDTIQKMWLPVFQKGADQYGYTTAQDRALRTQAAEGTSAAYKQTKQAVAEQQAAAGGDAYIPKGATTAINASLASAATAQERQQQLDITNKGYDLGRQNFLQASAALGGVAGMQNPLGYSGATSTAGSTASSTGYQAGGLYTDIQKADQAASPWNIVGGILGGGFGTALGGGLGTWISKPGPAKTASA